MPFVKVLLRPDEKDALDQLANIERRDPRAQAAILIRLELIKIGLLTDETVNFLGATDPVIPISSKDKNND